MVISIRTYKLCCTGPRYNKKEHCNVMPHATDSQTQKIKFRACGENMMNAYEQPMIADNPSANEEIKANKLLQCNL